MTDDGFFTFLARSGLLGDDARDLQQRDDIASLKERVELGERITRDGHATDLARLEAKLGALGREVAGLRIALDVLAHAVVEVGGLDAAVLDARMKEAIAREVAARAALVPIVCTNCGLKYPPAQAVDTPDGPLCKRCRALG